jgi:hypothetical protein
MLYGIFRVVTFQNAKINALAGITGKGILHGLYKFIIYLKGQDVCFFKDKINISILMFLFLATYLGLVTVSFCLVVASMLALSHCISAAMTAILLFYIISF